MFVLNASQQLFTESNPCHRSTNSLWPNTRSLPICIIFSKCPRQLHTSTAGGCVFSRWPFLNSLTGGRIFGCLSWFPCLTLGLVLVLNMVLVVGEVGRGVLVATWLPGGGTSHHIVAMTHQPSLTVGLLVLAQIPLAPALNPRWELIMKLQRDPLVGL